MAFHNVFIICTIAVLFIILSSVQCRRDSRQQLRPTRGFKDLDLAVARGFGKRAVNMHAINDLFLEWLAMETKMRNLRMPRRSMIDEDDLLPE